MSEPRAATLLETLARCLNLFLGPLTLRNVIDPSQRPWHSQGFSQVTDEAAATISAILTVLRGPGAPYTTSAECKHCTAVLLADMNEARFGSLHPLKALILIASSQTEGVEQSNRCCKRLQDLTCRCKHVARNQHMSGGTPIALRCIAPSQGPHDCPSNLAQQSTS